MSTITVTPKVRAISRALQSDADLVLVPGPVQSGKTYAAVLAFFHWAMHWSDTTFGAAAVSDAQFEQVILGKYREIFDSPAYALKPRKHHWEFPSVTGPPNRLVKFLGSHDESTRRHKGYTVQGMLLNEITEFPSDNSFLFLLTRASRPGAKVVADTNPEGPGHWAKLQVFDRAGLMNATVIPFVRADNPTHGPDDHARIAQIWPEDSPMYRRMVLGEWAMMSGSVYHGVDRAFRDVPAGNPFRFDVSVDVGVGSVTHGLLIAHYEDRTARHGVRSCVVDVYRHDVAADGEIPALTQVVHLVDWFTGRWPGFASKTGIWLIDAAGSSWPADFATVKQLRGLSGRREPIHKQDGIETMVTVTQTWMTSGRITIGPNCRKLKQELSGYVWDPKRVARNATPKPLKGKDHGADAFRYYVYMRNLAEVVSGFGGHIRPSRPASQPRRPNLGPVGVPGGGAKALNSRIRDGLVSV